MVYNLALLLPCAVCLVGAAWLICKRESKTFSEKVLVVGFLLSALFFLCTANYVARFLDSSTFMWWDIVDTFAAMFTIPTMYLYFRSIDTRGKIYVEGVRLVCAGIGGVGRYIHALYGYG